MKGEEGDERENPENDEFTEHLKLQAKLDKVVSKGAEPVSEDQVSPEQKWSGSL